MKYLHTMIRVKDLDVSLDFYCNCLGLIEVSRRECDVGKFTLVFLSAPDDLDDAQENKAPMIELTYNWEPEEYDSGRNFGHLAFRVEDIYETCQRLMEKGITINRPPKDGYMAFIKSPDNISIELLQQNDPLPTQSPWKDMETIGTW